MTTSGLPTPALSETGTLPTGVTFTDNGDGTATLAGTPAAGTNGVYSFSIGATNGISPDASQSFTLTVDVAPTITSADNTTFTEGAPGTFTVTSTGLPTAALIGVGRPAHRGQPSPTTATARPPWPAPRRRARTASTRSPSRPRTA